MKKIILVPLFFLLGIFMAVGQTANPSAENTWDLFNYKGSAAVVIINKDSARIQKDSSVLSFKINTENQFVYLIDKGNDQKALALLGIDKNEITKKYTSGPRLLPTEKLLTAAYSFPDQKLLIGATHSTAGDFDTNSSNDLDTGLQDQNFSENITAKNESNMDWIYLLITGLLALGIGIAIGRGTKGKKELIANNTKSELPKEDIQKLQSENLALQQKMSQTLAQLEELKSLDNIYFEKAFEKIILPLQESLEKGDKAKTLELLTIASAQLSSISRSKIGKKLKHDDANIQYLITQNKSNKEQFPEISAQTAIDKIPHNMKVLISLLKENNVKGLDDTIVMGYSIKNL